MKENQRILISFVISIITVIFLFQIIGIRSLIAMFTGEIMSWIIEIFMIFVGFGFGVNMFNKQEVFRKLANKK